MYGVANGDTTKRTEVFTAYQKSVPIADRLKGTWTLGQYEKNYTLAFAAAVKATNPGWKNGDPFDPGILDSVIFYGWKSSEDNAVFYGSCRFRRGSCGLG